jgi:hypothetical protein
VVQGHMSDACRHEMREQLRHILQLHHWKQAWGPTAHAYGHVTR